MVGYERGVVSDEAHGKGVLTWATGTRYKGAFVASKAHGHGEIRWPNGDRYQGQWRNDERHGEGIFIWASGKQVHGTTRSGLLHGPVAWTSPTGEQSIEEYNDGRRVAPSSRAPDNQFLPTPRDPARPDALIGGSSGGQEP